MQFITIDSIDDERVAAYTNLTEIQLRNRLEPERGLFIAESPKVIDRALAAGLCVTGFIECWQLLVGRAFDIDDLWLNTLGAFCGFWIWCLLDRAAPGWTRRFRVRQIQD